MIAAVQMMQKSGMRIRKLVCFVLWRKHSMPVSMPYAPPRADSRKSVPSLMRR